MTTTEPPTPLEAAAPAADHIRLGWGLAVFATVAFSLSAPLTKAALGLGLGTQQVLVARFVVSTLLLAGYGLALTPARLRLPWRGALIALAAGMLNGVSMAAFFTALNTLSASVASMTFSLYPLAVLGLLALRGERFTYRQYVRLALGLTGVYLLVGPEGIVDPGGLALVGVSVCVSALVTALMQWYLRGYDGQAVTFFSVTGITLTVTLHWLSQGAGWQALGAAGWGTVAALAVLGTVLSRLAWFAANQRLGSGQVALLVPLETFLSVVWSILFLNEALTPVQWLGGGLILLSALLAMQRLRRVTWRPWRQGYPNT